MKAMGRDPNIDKLTHGNVICDFLIDDFITLGVKKRLKPYAVPGINLGPRKPLVTLQNLTLGIAEVSLPSVSEQVISNKKNFDIQSSISPPKMTETLENVKLSKKKVQHRLTKKVTHLKDILWHLKNKRIMWDEAMNVLEKTYSGIPLAITKRNVANAQKCIRGKKQGRKKFLKN